MIAYLRGKILQKGHGFVIINTDSGIGYQVFIHSAKYAEVQLGDQLELYIHHHVKEDAQNLYGFNNFAELLFFKLLISISGVGPKSALGVLAVATVDDIKKSIAEGDPSLLNKVSGIGKKTAERIVLELRTKIDYLSHTSTSDGNTYSNSDEIDALVALGYSLQQARMAINKVDKKITNSGDKIRAALKHL